jgi:hypothetical protein
VLLLEVGAFKLEVCFMGIYHFAFTLKIAPSAKFLVCASAPIQYNEIGGLFGGDLAFAIKILPRAPPPATAFERHKQQSLPCQRPEYGIHKQRQKGKICRRRHKKNVGKENLTDVTSTIWVCFYAAQPGAADKSDTGIGLC